MNNLPNIFANSRNWYLVELSNFSHDDVNFPKNKSIIRLFHDFDFCVETIESLKNKFGNFTIKVFSCIPPIFDGDLNYNQIKDETKWEYWADNDWHTINYQDTISSLNERLWHSINSNAFQDEDIENNL